MRFELSDKKIRVRVGGLIVNDGMILLIAHKKENNLYWLLPGGGVEYQESLDAALKRELSEELGIEIEVGDVAIVADSIEPNGNRHIINIIFLCTLVNDAIQLGNESILFGYTFKPLKELENIVMYPPLNKHIINYIHNKSKQIIYKGSLWIP